MTPDSLDGCHSTGARRRSGARAPDRHRPRARSPRRSSPLGPEPGARRRRGRDLALAPQPDRARAGAESLDRPCLAPRVDRRTRSLGADVCQRNGAPGYRTSSTSIGSGLSCTRRSPGGTKWSSVAEGIREHGTVSSVPAATLRVSKPKSTSTTGRRWSDGSLFASGIPGWKSSSSCWPTRATTEPSCASSGRR